MKKLFMFMTLTLALFIASAASVYALPPASGEQWQGIDVSEWQGNINFEQVAASGIKVVYIRSSLGSSYIDPYFQQNYQRAKAAGLKIGFYHYVTARSVPQAQSQARFFAQVIQGKKFDCRLAMDFEDLTNLSAAQATEIGLAFIRETEKVSGKKAVVYSNTYNAGAMFSGALTKYPLWAASYGVSQPSSAVNWTSWAGWQYTDRGQIPGISGYVDRDIFTSAMLLKSSGQVKPDPSPTPSPGTITYQVKPGDTLWDIARRYNTSVAAIAQENNISNPQLIYPGQTLRIRTDDAATDTDSYTYYTVRTGDTLSHIALRFQTTVQRLASMNKITNPNLIHTGEQLRIPTSNASANATYTVRPGDTLWEIALRNNTSVAHLTSINNIINPNLIYPGEVIRLP